MSALGDHAMNTGVSPAAALASFALFYYLFTPTDVTKHSTVNKLGTALSISALHSLLQHFQQLGRQLLD